MFFALADNLYLSGNGVQLSSPAAGVIPESIRTASPSCLRCPRANGLLVATNVGETRGYKGLAKMARWSMLMLLQDDWHLTGGCGWLAESTHVMSSGVLLLSRVACAVWYPTSEIGWTWSELSAAGSNTKV